MGRIHSYGSINEITRLSVATLLAGIATACIGGVALASDTPSVVTPDATPAAVAPVTTTDTKTAASSSESNLVVSTTGDSSSLVQQVSKSEVTTALSLSATQTTPTEDKSAALALSSTPTDTGAAGSPAPLTTDTAPVSVPSVQTPPIIEVASAAVLSKKQAARVQYYRDVIERTNVAQNSLDKTPFAPPVVSDSGTGVPSGSRGNTPVPVETSGLFGVFTSALEVTVVPNSISSFFSYGSIPGNVPVRVISLFVILVGFLQGFILLMRRAGFTMAPRAGIGSRFSLAAPQLMSHFVPIEGPK